MTARRRSTAALFCERCGESLRRSEAEGVAGYMDLFNPSAGITYHTWRCVDHDACERRVTENERIAK